MPPSDSQRRLFNMLELTDVLASDAAPVVSMTEFLAALEWRSEADPELLAAATARRPRRFAKRLAKTGVPRASQLGRGVATSGELLAELPPAAASQVLLQLTRETALAACRKATREELGNHCTALLDAADGEPQLPLEVLAVWLGLLPAVARRLEPDVWLRLWRRSLLETRRVAGEYGGMESDPTGISSELQDESLFRAGIVFGALAEAEAWLAAGREGWRNRLSQAEDSASPPQSWGGVSGDWWASLVRTTTDAAAFGVTLWKKSQLRFLRGWAQQLTARLLPDGTLAGREAEQRPSLAVVGNLVRLVGGDQESSPATLIRDVARGRRSRPSPLSKGRASRPAHQSDVERQALLRSDWSTAASLFALDYSGSEVELDFSVAGRRLLRGVWTPAVVIDGQRIDLRSGWKCDCWFSDKDGDFAEISTPLGEGRSLMRQIFLGRREQIGVIAEAIRGANPDAAVSLASTMPVANGVQPEADGFTREIQWPVGRERVRMFALHLPWERTLAGEGGMRLHAEGLQMSSVGKGNRCQVLLFDWRGRDLDAAADGGPLSVAERGKHVSPHDACAGRVRVGSRQWFYWHNLTVGEVPRSCLGHHTADETVIGRVKSGGAVDILVHVQGDSAQESDKN